MMGTTPAPAAVDDGVLEIVGVLLRVFEWVGVVEFVLDTVFE